MVRERRLRSAAAQRPFIIYCFYLLMCTTTLNTLHFQINLFFPFLKRPKNHPMPKEVVLWTHFYHIGGSNKLQNRPPTKPLYHIICVHTIYILYIYVGLVSFIARFSVHLSPVAQQTVADFFSYLFRLFYTFGRFLFYLYLFSVMSCRCFYTISLTNFNDVGPAQPDRGHQTAAKEHTAATIYRPVMCA